MPVKVLVVGGERAPGHAGYDSEIEGSRLGTASSAKSAQEFPCRLSLGLVVTDLTMETPTAGYDVVAARKYSQPPAVLVISGYFDVLKD